MLFLHKTHSTWRLLPGRWIVHPNFVKVIPKFKCGILSLISMTYTTSPRLGLTRSVQTTRGNGFVSAFAEGVISPARLTSGR